MSALRLLAIASLRFLGVFTLEKAGITHMIATPASEARQKSVEGDGQTLKAVQEIGCAGGAFCHHDPSKDIEIH
jgi:hypothetical protein